MSQRARKARVILAWCLLVGAAVMWPISALWLARDEPQFVLGLSFLAIVIEAGSLVTASQVHQEQGEGSEG